jgi:hypothetical protein
MRSTRYFYIGAAVIFSLAVSTATFAQPGHGHGKGHNKHDRGDDDDDDQGHRGYNDHDREAIREWYHHHRDDLPPGLAKRDELPPGLERQLEVRHSLPPGLRKKIHDCPEDLERRLPPPPPDYRHVLIGGHVVLLNARTFVVIDIFHFER